MDWVNRINEVIAYAENELPEEIDTVKISKIMGCPYPVFQRSFVQIMGITLQEYIEQRKSSNASLRVTQSVNIAQEINYRYIEKKAFKVIGKRKTTQAGGGGIWETAHEDGSIDQIMKIMEMTEPAKPFLGLSFGFGGDRSEEGMIGIEYDGGDIEGLESYSCPESSWLIFTDEGKPNGKIFHKMREKIYSDFLPQSEYKQSDLPTIETCTEWDTKNNFCKLEVWIPVY